MPPVTTRPENGSRLQIFWMYGGISSSNVVTVALIHFECSGSEQNTSGWPKLGSCAAMRRHISQPPPGLISGAHAAGSVCEPIEEFSTQPPLVMNTRSFSPKSMLRVVPSASVRSMRVAYFRVCELNGLRAIRAVLGLFRENLILPCAGVPAYRPIATANRELHVLHLHVVVELHAKLSK